MSLWDSAVKNEPQIFDIVSLVAFLLNVSKIQKFERGGKIIWLQNVTLKDAADDIPLALFGRMVDIIEEKSTNILTILTVSKYEFFRLLMTRDSTKITLTAGGISVHD